MIISKDKGPINSLLNILPKGVSQSISLLDTNVLNKISEIRLHCDGVTCITVNGINCFLGQNGVTENAAESIITSKKDIEDFLYSFCKGSVYSHENTISEFYVSINGIRVGICGEAVKTKSGTVTIGSISSINIRIPRHIQGCSTFLFNHIKKHGFKNGKGILIASSPGVGKTTLLRDLAIKLSSGIENVPYRICVIDERKEIFMPNLFRYCCADFIRGVTKIEGIETATRLFSPEIIICDEIANSKESELITERKNSGVIFICSIHSDSCKNAVEIPYIKKMFNEGVFGSICCLNRERGNTSGVITEFDTDA